MPSLQDSALIFLLALLLFGPKQLPKLARELGKWIGEFRRASNEFKMQMEEELRLADQAERDDKVRAIEAAAPPAPRLEGIPTEEPEHPHLSDSSRDYPIEPIVTDSSTNTYAETYPETGSHHEESALPIEPIATSGDLHLMPPATGLPVGRSSSSASIAPLIDSIPVTETAQIETPRAEKSSANERAAENATHG